MGFLRHPKTTAEIRANQDGWHRGKRSRRQLPTVFDDLFASARLNRNWKQFRKTKYKVI